MDFDITNKLVELVESSKAGDNNSFDTLFQAYRKSLYLTAMVILENQYDAEDAVQDTAVLALFSIKALKTNQYFKTWLTKILINRCRRMRALKSKNKIVELMENTLWVDPLTVDELTLWEAINTLEKDDRIIITLRFFNDLSISEIADVLKCPIGTTKSSLHRAILKLRKIMNKE